MEGSGSGLIYGTMRCLPGKTEDNHERTQEAIFAGNETAVDMQPV
jgi:hypothetical protein